MGLFDKSAEGTTEKDQTIASQSQEIERLNTENAELRQRAERAERDYGFSQDEGREFAELADQQQAQNQQRWQEVQFLRHTLDTIEKTVDDAKILVNDEYDKLAELSTEDRLERTADEHGLILRSVNSKAAEVEGKLTGLPEKFLDDIGVDIPEGVRNAIRDQAGRDEGFANGDVEIPQEVRDLIEGLEREGHTIGGIFRQTSEGTEQVA